MLAKRIIPCLDIKDGRTVKGVNFFNLKDAGDPIELAVNYSQNNADELVFLDISATEQKRKTLHELVYEIAKSIDIPFTVGGGIKSIKDVEKLLKKIEKLTGVASSKITWTLSHPSPGQRIKAIRDLEGSWMTKIKDQN